MGKAELMVKREVAIFREKAGLNQSEPIKMDSLLLKLNILTVFKPLSENFSGMALKIRNNRFILINSNQPIGRQNFTIGHEFYHLFVQKDFLPHRCTTGHFDKSSITEYYADLFSANLLMPEDGLLVQIPNEELALNKIKTGTLLELEQMFGVSHLALLYRLLGLGIVSKIFLEENKNEIIRTAQSYGFDTNIYKPGNSNKVIGDYKVIAHELFNQEKISEGHFLELMNTYSDGEEE